MVDAVALEAMVLRRAGSNPVLGTRQGRGESNPAPSALLVRKICYVVKPKPLESFVNLPLRFLFGFRVLTRQVKISQNWNPCPSETIQRHGGSGALYVYLRRGG